jgi:hypothetical protein
MCLSSAHCGEDCSRSEILVLEGEQRSPAPGAIDRTLLDHASSGNAVAVAHSHGKPQPQPLRSTCFRGSDRRCYLFTHGRATSRYLARLAQKPTNEALAVDLADVDPWSRRYLTPVHRTTSARRPATVHDRFYQRAWQSLDRGDRRR